MTNSGTSSRQQEANRGNRGLLEDVGSGAEDEKKTERGPLSG